MSEALILSIDAGSQSVRAMAFSRRGELRARVQISTHDSLFQDGEIVEVDLDLYFEAVERAIKEVQALVAAQGDSFSAMVLTAQRATLCLLDEQGLPLSKAVSWMDRRQYLGEQLSPWYWRLAIRVAGHGKVFDRVCRHATVARIRQQQPALLPQLKKVCLLSSYLHLRLCGDYKDSRANQVGYLPFSYRRQRWAGRFDWKWPAYAVDKNQLPELVDVNQTIGSLKSDISDRLGLPQRLPIYASAADKACEILGSGCHDGAQAAVSYGTAATYNIVTSRYLEAIKPMPAYPSAVAEGFHYEYQLFRGFWLISWFIEQFAPDERRQAQSEGVSVESLCNQHLDHIPAGCDGLLVQPYWSPGVKYPDTDARGSMIGFTDKHSKWHIYRAIIEGIVFALRYGKEMIEKGSGQKAAVIMVSGGGSNSQEILQITADIFNLPVQTAQTSETSGLGAAINAAVGLAWYPSEADAVAAMVHLSKPIFPRAAEVALYEDRYQNVYRKLYAKLKPLYQHLN